MTIQSGGRFDNRERRDEIVKETKKCGRCPAHGGENMRRRPKPDRYKDWRRGRGARRPDHARAWEVMVLWNRAGEVRL